jgi:hypothetical protein
MAAAVDKQEPPPLPIAATEVAKADPAKASEPAKTTDPVLARIEALEAANRELAAKLATASEQITSASGSVRTRMAAELFGSVDMKPEYHRFALQEIGDLDPSSDAAKAKVDTLVKAFPDWVKPKQAAAQLNSEWVTRVTNKQKDPKSTRGTMLGAISGEQLAAFTRGNR